MKALTRTAIATVILGAMSVVQIGVAAAQSTDAGINETDQVASEEPSEAATIPGADEAQAAAWDPATVGAVAGGVALLGIIAAAGSSSSGGSSSSSGTGGTSGTTGTTPGSAAP